MSRYGYTLHPVRYGKGFHDLIKLKYISQKQTTSWFEFHFLFVLSEGFNNITMVVYQA